MSGKGNRNRAKNKIIWDNKETLQVEEPCDHGKIPEWLVELRKVIGFVEQDNRLDEVERETRLMIRKFAK